MHTKRLTAFLVIINMALTISITNILFAYNEPIIIDPVSGERIWFEIPGYGPAYVNYSYPSINFQNQPYNYGWNQPYNYGWNQPYGYQPYNYGRGQLYIYDPNHDYGYSIMEPLLTAAGDPGHFHPPGGWYGPLSNFFMNQPFNTFLTFGSGPSYGPRPYGPLNPYIPEPDWYLKSGFIPLY